MRGGQVTDIYWSPRHWMQLKSTHEGLKCVSGTDDVAANMCLSPPRAVAVGHHASGGLARGDAEGVHVRGETRDLPHQHLRRHVAHRPQL